MTSQDRSQELAARIRQAAESGTPLALQGGNSKAFYGGTPRGEPLSFHGHVGIVNYEPRELVITARSGTPLDKLEQVLAEQGQMLAFEPPHFGEHATLGGAIACGLSGPRRPYSGAARDFVLGCRLINGRGEILHFGGEVMKNVAGYDVSRLMTGALGTLGALLEISLKVLPKPEHEITLVQQRSPQDALRVLNLWAGKPLPISAAVYDGIQLHIRLSGSEQGIAAARNTLGGDSDHRGETFWHGIREQRHPLFRADRPLWRLSLPADAPHFEPPGKQLIDWGGAQRWLVSDAPAKKIRALAEHHRGHATLFRNGDGQTPCFHPQPAALLTLQRRIKEAFDPQGILNPGRLQEAW